MRGKTITLERKKVEEEVEYRIKKNGEVKNPIEEIVYHFVKDIVSKEIVKFIKEKKKYRLNEMCEGIDDEEELKELIEKDQVVVEDGVYSPLDYDELWEFLDETAQEYSTYYNWGELKIERETIISEIYDKIEEVYEKEKQILIDLITSGNFEDKIKDFQIEKIIIETYEKKVQHIKTEKVTIRRETKNRVTTMENQPEELLDDLKEAMAFFIECLLEDIMAGDVLSNCLEELNDESFRVLYLNGCHLLGIEDEFYKLLSYKGTAEEEYLFKIMKECVSNKTFVNETGSSLRHIPKPFPRKRGGDFTKPQEVYNEVYKLMEMKDDAIYAVVNKELTEQEIDNALKILSSIYLNEYPCDVQELRELFKFSFIKNVLLSAGVKKIKEEILPNYLSKIQLREALKLTPKDYYPMARSIKRHFILHIGDTNSGKTYDSLQRFKEVESAVYLAPLRLLALEVQEKMIKEGLLCDLSTGTEEVILENAKHISSTIEKLNYDKTYDVAVIDEAQMIEDSQRGHSWTEAILGVCAKEIHLCFAPYVKDIIIELINYCGDSYEEVYHKRDVELIVKHEAFNFVKDTQKGDALVVFSKRKALNLAYKISKETNLTCSILYGSLPYKSRKRQFEKFANGEADVLVTTDAIGMGVNLAIKRVIFMENRKFDGNNVRNLKTTELLQIGGRAGRKNIYDKGYVIMKKKKMVDSFYKEIKPLQHLYLGLNDRLLEVQGDLTSILSEWQKVDLEKPFVKTDISNQLTILRSIDDIQIEKRDKFKALFLPVNTNSVYEMTLLREYICALSNKKEVVTFPFLPNLEYENELNQYESYSKGIDLYYSFCKTFNLPLDLDKVEKERERATNKINNLLLSSQLKPVKCSKCGKELAWDYDRFKCEDCSYLPYDYYYYY